MKVDRITSTGHPAGFSQGKIERWHQALKNRIELDVFFLPGALETAIGNFINHNNHRHCHEGPGNLTPAGDDFGRTASIP